ncbi:sugar transporter [Sphingomonas panacisoli]|uniref:Sugar transporter n=1 Tax=Sphingomonas panacisoli TaxID=1813879 RepID=A0A5B8LKG6_9SPHN|nr:polysaccharide biosynthesis/export family protein [Sphingomonas panacisoli]QDZ08042.1 sugar transporter [Sphingomonas panacisoli]
MAMMAIPLSAPATAQATADTSATQATYTINAGDELEIYVWGEERLQRVLHVLPDGTIAFPLVGQLRVQGLLPQAVERLVSERLKSQYKGDVPNVTVSVRSPVGLSFSVVGKVRSPGSFNPGRYINVLDAVSLAGGPADFANLDGVSIIRHQGSQLITLKVKLGSVFKGSASGSTLDKTNIVPLVAGDIVVVP